MGEWKTDNIATDVTVQETPKNIYEKQTTNFREMFTLIRL